MILTRDGKEVIAIYKQNGDEVDEVKDANGRLVYTNTREITGALPLSFTSHGKPLSDYRISGNTVQDGTPTPDTPVDVVGCGMRTGNLLEITDNMKNSTKWVLSPSLGVEPKRYFEVYDITNIVPRGIISANIFENFEPGYEPGLLVCAITSENTATVDENYRILTNNGVITPRTFDITSWNNVYLCIGYGKSFDNEAAKQQKIDELFNNWKIMLNVGSTALPYEPYGYKLPLTINGTEYPIYLGEVPTTRMIKKLVLTGGENWSATGSSGHSWIITKRDFLPPASSGVKGLIISSHYETINFNQSYAGSKTGISETSTENKINICDTSISSISDFKSFLSQQYTNGTPVTIWYVLATPETAVVNEPLMKFGNYADTITMAQAGVTIPTVSGTNVLDMSSPVKPSEVYIKGKGIKSIT